MRPPYRLVPAPLRPHIFVLILFAALLCISSAFFVFRYQRFLHERTASMLDTVIDMKSDQLRQWRRVQLAVARQAAGNGILVRTITAAIADPSNRRVRAELETWAAGMKKNFDLKGLYVYDTRLRPLVSAGPPRHESDTYTMGALRQALKANLIQFDDFHIDAGTKKAEIDIYIPLTLPDDPKHTPVAGIVVSFDPYAYLYPMLQYWPVTSLSAETLLVKRNGAHLTYLNELRYKKNAALLFSIDLNDDTIPVVKAVKGFSGTTQGVDYRGVRVIAAARRVPDSPWFLVTKIDRAEVYRELFLFSAFIALADTALLLAAALLLGYYEKRRALAREAVQRAQEHEARLEERHRELLSTHACDAIFLLDRFLRVISANEQAGKEFGIAQNWQPAANMAGLVAAGEQANFRSRIAQLSAETPAVFVTSFQHSDGAIFPAEATARAFDIDGSRYYQLIIRSRTCEPAGTDAEPMENYREIFNSINDCIFIHDLQSGGVVDVNARTVERWGYSADEIKRQGPNILGAGEEPYTAVHAREWVKRAILAGPQVFEWQSRNKAGEKFWVEVSLRCTTIQGKDRVLAVVRDIEERRKTEAILRESEQRYRQLVELSPAAIAIHAEGKILFANPAAVRMFGADSLEQLQKKPLADLIHPAYRALAVERITAAMEGGGPLQAHEEKFLKFDGSEITAEIMRVPFMYQGKRAIETVFADITERRKAIEELRKSEERYRAIYEGSRDVIYVLSPEGNFLSINPAIEVISGWQQEQLIGKHFTMLMHPDDAPAAREHFLKTARGELQPPYEARFLIKNGDQRIGEVKANPIYQDGKIVAVQGTVSDITEHRRSEEIIRRSRDYFMKLFDQMPYPVWVSDASGVFVYFNNAWKDLVNITDSPTATADIIARIHPEDLERCRASAVRLIQDHASIDDSCRIRCDDGVMRWFSMSVRPFDDLDGKFGGFIGTSYDITTLKFAQDELQRNYQKQSVLNQLLRTSIESSGMHEIMDKVLAEVAAIPWLPLENKGIFRIRNKDAASFSVIAQRGFGPEISEVCARAPQPTCVCARAISSGDVVVEDPSHDSCALGHGRHCCIPVAMGADRQALLHLFLRENSGLSAADTAFLTTIADVIAGIVQRTQAEAEKEEYQARMIQSGKMAALGQMAAGVAHELNNPLTIIIGNSQHLKHVDAWNDNTKTVLQEIDNAAQRCKKIVSDLLEFSRKRDMAFHPTPVNGLVEAVLKMSSSQEGYKAVSIVKELASGLPDVSVSFSHIEQVFLNIVINAIQAMPGGGTLRVITRPGPDGRSVETVFEDSGVGMAADVIGRIFDPFYTTKPQGTGLGLAISYNIIRQHGGKLSVDSAGPGKGTAFTISLPTER